MTVRVRTSVPGLRIQGVMATPSVQPAPAVLVLHEIAGLDRAVRDACDRLASAGYVAFAPDLYARHFKPFCIAQTLVRLARNEQPPVGDLTRYVEWLRRQPGVAPDAVGAIGFCMGGGFALALAIAGGISATGVNYGGVPATLDEVRGVCPVVASYGGDDERFAADGRRLESFLFELGVAHDIKIYDGATHSFMNEHHPRLVRRLFTVRYDPAATEDAWTRTLSFFDAHLD